MVDVFLAILVAKLQRSKKCLCKGNAFYLLLFFISVVWGNYHPCLIVKTESNIVSSSEITPEAVSMIDVLLNNFLRDNFKTFTN